MHRSTRCFERAFAIFALTPVRVLLVYLASRIYSSALLAAMLAAANAARWPFIGIRGKPSFFVFSGSWDGWFYRCIAEHGYPTTLPVDAAGHVLPNEWAFLPVFPLVERLVTHLFGVTTFTAGTLIALTAGAGTALVLERLLRDHIGKQRALRAVTLFCFCPLAFVLQVAYAESLFLLLLFAALTALHRGRYLTALPLVLVAAFTRPGAIALCAGLALQLALQWHATQQRPPRLGTAAITIMLGTTASIAWAPIADAVTGTHGSYLATELSWWTGWVGRPLFIPFTPWFLMTSRWLGPAGVISAALLAITLSYWILRRARPELGHTITAFSITYVLYLIAVFLPQFSLPRLLMPLAPLLGASTFTATRIRAARWLFTAAAMQSVGVALLWYLGFP